MLVLGVSETDTVDIFSPNGDLMGSVVRINYRNIGFSFPKSYRIIRRQKKERAVLPQEAPAGKSTK